MSLLSAQVVEVLEWITSVISTSDQIRLWQCGDRILNIKLKNGGLKKTSLQWSSSPWMPWPRLFFTTFNGLEEVYWNTTAGSSLCPTLDFNLLPKTLKCLQINCEDVFCRMRIQNVKLNELFPNLTRLKLEGKRLSEMDLKHLPSGLIDLFVTAYDREISCSILKDLPRTLQDLELWCGLTDLGQYEDDFPSGLKTLTITYKDNKLTKLPKSLKSLRAYTDDELNFSDLPSKLERLCCLFISEDLLSQLPPTLKTLDDLMEIGDDEIELLSNHVSLTRLGASECDVTHRGLKKLPKSVTDFDVTVGATRPEILSWYPAETTKIRLEACDATMDLVLSPFPAKLTYLQFPKISDEICAMLPPTLTYLNLEQGLMRLTDQGTITALGASKLPKSLKTLIVELAVFDANETICHIAFVPDLQFKCTGPLPERINDAWTSHLSPRDTQTKNHQLKIEFENTFSLTSNSLQNLAKYDHVTALSIKTIIASSSSVLRFIPANVTSLKIGPLNSYPNTYELSLLPKCLQNLELKFEGDIECPWKDEDLESLPRALKILSVSTDPTSIRRLTSEMSKFVPPFMQEMKANDEPFLQFVDPLERLYGEQ